MAKQSSEKTIVVQGHRVEAATAETLLDDDFAGLLQVTVRRESEVRLAPDRSGDTHPISLTATDDDVVELTLEGNLQLFTSVQRLREDIVTSGRRRSVAGEELRIPRRLVFSGQRTRSEDGLLVEGLKLLDIEGRLIDHVTGKAAAFTARKLAELLEQRLIGEGGLVRLRQTGNTGEESVAFEPVKPQEIDSSRPILLFLHGTASSTAGSFSELWRLAYDDTWQQVTDYYGDNILSLQHRTLTESPIANALGLMQALPDKARLHLVSHSRGGLVGELLCRGQLSESREPFTQEEIALFQGDALPGLLGSLGEEVAKDYQRHRAQLQRLNTLLIEKQPQVERFVRVGCPARGTTLASGKLDIYLSGILNVIGQIPFLKSNPLYGFLKTFTLAVAKQRTRPEQLPGLEAQMPGSPLIALLNTAPVSSRAPLAVIEGDIEPAGIFKKIAMFFLDRFYESDHDLVVNTPSMDGGTRRSLPIPVLFDRGKAVNHFQYFTNKRTRQGLLAALTESGMPPTGFQLRPQKPRRVARSLPRGAVSGQVPAVFVLPGISGSHLAVDGDRIWVDPFDLMRGRFTRLKFDADDVTAEELVGSAYGDLIDFLSNSHEVIPFPYDWRRSVLENGRHLAAAVDERLRNTDQPVRIIAHSMGGLVFRGMAAEAQDVWERMRAREGSRVLMLGTPNHGSHSIPRIFARQDRLIKLLAAADLRHDHDQLLQVLRRFQGILELLPVDSDQRLPADALWDDYQRCLGKDWKRPLKTDLATAQKTWDKLTGKGLDASHVFYIAGHADETPVAQAVDDENQGGSRIRFFSSPRGDGQVPWDSGIPAGIRHWYVDAVHGDIADHEPAFAAILEILESGDTQRLSSKPHAARGVPERREMLPDQIEVYPSEEAIYAAALGKAPENRRPRRPPQPTLQVRVTHGDLCFAQSPIAVGHYQGDTIVSAEAALDARLDGRLSQRLQLGLYPGPLLSHDVLFSLDDSQFHGAVVVGLGEVGTLTPGRLSDSFREAVLRFAVSGMERKAFNDEGIRLSSLLIGTGAGGMTTEDAMTAMLRAVIQANRLLAGPTNVVERTVLSLTFIELFEDAAVSAQHILRRIAANPEFRGRVETQPELITGDGGRRRVYYQEDPDWWQRLRIESLEDGSLKFTSLTARGARAEMLSQPIQRQSVAPFLKAMTADTSTDSRAGRTLFELLIPREFKVHAPENQDLVLVVDKEAAAYPWELLEYAGFDGDEALAIKSGMIRQLASPDSDLTSICNNRRALVIGNPQVDDDRFADLPGARREAEMVHDLLSARGYQLPWQRRLIGSTGAEILSALMTDQYQILHLAGHGVVDLPLPGTAPEQRASGMVIGKDHLLTPVELRQMPSTPAFVFINCCHLGSTAAAGTARLDRPYALAANLATQLIRQGVRAVIAAGWAVDDAAAETFAQTFYQAFLSGISFGKAVKRARENTYQKHGSVNTWGAYQCYGDPGYNLKAGAAGGGKQSRPGFVSLAEYVTALDNLAERAKTALPAEAGRLRVSLEKLSGDIPEKWSTDGRLLEALGRAWGELDVFDLAIDAYRQALTADPAQASIRCAEQLSNLETRYALALQQQSLPPQAAREPDAAALKKIRSQVLALLDSADERIAWLNRQFGETVERLALAGSLHKRRAQMSRNNRRSLGSALKKMRNAYEKSHLQALDRSGRLDPYPLTNWLTARWLLRTTGIDKTDKLVDSDSLLGQAMTQTAVAESDLDREHFWDAVAENDCRLLLLLLQGGLDDTQADAVCGKYKAIRRIASSPRQFRSVQEHLAFLREMMHSLDLESERKQIERLIDCLRSDGDG